MTNSGTGLPHPEAAVVPALVSVFDSEVTSLGCVTIHPLGYVLPSDKPYFTDNLSEQMKHLLQLASSDFPIRNQKLKVPLPNGSSQFGTVSSVEFAHTKTTDPIRQKQLWQTVTESYWQALSYVFDWAFHG